MPRPAAHPNEVVGDDIEPTRRTRARRGEGERLRDEILEAATQLLAETGDADKVSIRAVAQRVGCTSPALYLHFPDKATLMYDVCERQFDQLSEVLAAAAVGVADPVERLLVVMQAYVDFALSHPEQYRIMMLDGSYSSGFEATLGELAASTGFLTVVQALEDGMAAGTFAPTDPQVTSFMLWANVHGLVSLLLVKPGLSLPVSSDELIQLAVQQQLDGLLVRSPAPSRAARPVRSPRPAAAARRSRR